MISTEEFVLARTKRQQATMDAVLAAIDSGTRQLTNKHTGEVRDFHGYIIRDNRIICPLFEGERSFLLSPMTWDQKTSTLVWDFGFPTEIFTLGNESLALAARLFEQENYTGMMPVTEYHVFEKGDQS